MKTYKGTSKTPTPKKNIIDYNKLPKPKMFKSMLPSVVKALRQYNFYKREVE